MTRRVVEKKPWTFIDLFSGAGGMSFGFHAHGRFRIAAAFDGEFGKPSAPPGGLGCNATFELNTGISPTRVDLGDVDESFIRKVRRDRLGDRDLDVLSACPPCTGFSRANPSNHTVDDVRNSLVLRTAAWVRALRPRVVVMENARELVNGSFKHHFAGFRRTLEGLGYEVSATVHMLDAFGLPQRRERAIVLATTVNGGVRTLEELWVGYTVDKCALTVRRAIGDLPALHAGDRDPNDPHHKSPKMGEATLARTKAIPKDGGSWIDLLASSQGDRLLTPAMRRLIQAGDFGSHPDVYGRLHWDRPAVTVKRECAHVGNGRYTHPEQDRLCSVRELALLQGFPRHFRFGGDSLANQYRHIGDAVPPLVSYQLAHLTEWMLTGERPEPAQCVLPMTSLSPADVLVQTGKPLTIPQQLSLFSRPSQSTANCQRA